LNCPNKNPTIGSVNWYIGKIRMILNGQYIKPLVTVLDIPRKAVTGFATHAAKEPLIAKTINISII
jgi:hypothetical protein